MIDHIDWDSIEDRTGMLIAYSLLVICGGIVGLAVVCFMALIVLSGILLTLQGWWGVGIPITVVGLVLSVAVLLFLLAKFMVWVKEKVKR